MIRICYRLTERISLSPMLLMVGGILSILLTPAALANEIGRDAQNFNTTANAQDYITVHSIETLGQGRLGLGLHINQAINSLPYFETEDGTKQDRTRFNDSVLTGEAHIGYGLLPFWDLGVSLPAILDQKVKKSEDFHAEYDEKGLLEYRLITKVKLPGLKHKGFGLLASANFNQTQNDPYSGRKSGPTYNIEAAAEISLANILLAANLGYRFREPGEKLADDLPIEPINSQYIASGAAGFIFPGTRLKAILELFGSLPQKSVEELSDRGLITSEALIGLKYFSQYNLVWSTGVGSELRQAIGSPDWRFFAGVNWYTEGSAKAAPERQIISQASPAEPPAEITRSPDEVVIISDILFEFDSAKFVNPGAKDNLANLVKKIKQEKIKEISIGGHTCNMGGASYNQKLSQRRAEAIRQYLIKHLQFPADKIHARGFGEVKPVADNKAREGRKANRRVEFKLWK